MIEIVDMVPVTVIMVSIAITELLKRLMKGPKGKKFLKDFVWLPSMIVGVLAAILLTDNFLSKDGIWTAVTYGVLAPFVVLVLKPIVGFLETKKATRATKTP